MMIGGVEWGDQKYNKKKLNKYVYFEQTKNLENTHKNLFQVCFSIKIHRPHVICLPRNLFDCYHNAT